MSRWDLPVPESPIRHSGVPASIHAPMARAARVAGLIPGATVTSKSSRRLNAREAGLDDAPGSVADVAVVDLGGEDLGGEDLGQIGPVGETVFGGLVGEGDRFGSDLGQRQHSGGGADGGLRSGFAHGGHGVHAPAPGRSS